MPRTYSVTFTKLGLTATPTRLYGSFAARAAGSGVARPPFVAGFTRFGLTATPTRNYGSFTGKAANITQTPNVSDTYIVVMTMQNVDAVDSFVSDVYTPVITMASSAGLLVAPTDTYRPQWTMTVGQLAKQPDTVFGVSDTYTPVLTMTSALAFAQTVADTYTVVFTMDTPTVEKIPVATVADDYVVTLTMSPALYTSSGFIDRAVTDVYTPLLAMTARIANAGEVDIIHIRGRKTGHIRITET